MSKKRKYILHLKCTLDLEMYCRCICIYNRKYKMYYWLFTKGFLTNSSTDFTLPRILQFSISTWSTKRFISSTFLRFCIYVYREGCVCVAFLLFQNTWQVPFPLFSCSLDFPLYIQHTFIRQFLNCLDTSHLILFFSTITFRWLKRPPTIINHCGKF